MCIFVHIHKCMCEICLFFPCASLQLKRKSSLTVITFSLRRYDALDDNSDLLIQPSFFNCIILNLKGRKQGKTKIISLQASCFGNILAQFGLWERVRQGKQRFEILCTCSFASVFSTRLPVTVGVWQTPPSPTCPVTHWGTRLIQLQNKISSDIQ